MSRKGSDIAKKFQGDAIGTFRHNSTLTKEILAKIQPVYLTTPNGVIFEKGFRALWDSEAHDAVIEKMIRGFYFYHFKEILGDKADVTVHWYRSLTREMIDISKSWGLNKVGDEVVYRFARVPNSNHSIWIFQFYNAHWAGGYTSPKL